MHRGGAIAVAAYGRPEMWGWRSEVVLFSLPGVLVEVVSICHYAKYKRSGVEGCGVKIRHRRWSSMWMSW
jgi:hypothetical protein